MGAHAPDESNATGRLRSIASTLHKCVRNLTTKDDEKGVDLVESEEEVYSLLICLETGFIERVFKKPMNHVMEKLKHHIAIQEKAEEEKKKAQSAMQTSFGFRPAPYHGFPPGFRPFGYGN